MSVFNLNKLNEQVFYINDYCVDAKRNTISNNGNVQSIEPKVMQLLLVLVSENGNVVSQEMLFEQVWPNSVFSPGSIRRAIAILRKALGTDSTENLLKTIPKIGYELNAKISFNRKVNGKNKTTYIVISILFCLLLVFSIVILHNDDDKVLVTQIEPITATSALEFNAKLSPNNKLIAFIRSDNKGNQLRSLWIKELASGNEKLVIANQVSEFTWLPSAQKIVFTNKEHNKLILQQVNLLTSTVKSLIILSDHIQPASSLQSGNNDNLYVLGYLSNLNSDKKTALAQKSLLLLSINLKTKKINKQLTFDETHHPYEISTNRQGNKLAIAGFNQQGQTTIKIFDLESNQFTSQEIVLDKNRYFLSWHPSDEELLLSDGRHLSTVNLSGEWQKLNYESYDFVQHPQYSKNADAIFFSYAKLDIDIALTDLTKGNTSTKLVDSNTVDRAPSLSPDRKKLAFISHRKGYPQVYILDLQNNSLLLAYENIQQSLGISPPVWGGNKRLAFSNYHYPVVVTLHKEKPYAEQFKKPLGIVSDFYQDNSLLLYAPKQSSHIKVAIDSEQILQRYSELASRVKLGNNNDLCFIVKQEFVCKNDNQQFNIFHFSAPVIDWRKSGNQFLFTVKNKQGNKLIILNSLDYQLIENFNLPPSINNVFAVYNQQIISQQKNLQKDIIKLVLNE